VLSSNRIAATIPAWDMERAKSYYTETLGFSVKLEDPAGVQFESGGVEFGIFPTFSGEPASHTIAAWQVDDLEAEMAELRDRGVTFEEYDMPGFKTENGIADLGGGKGCWFKDSEGNTLAIFRRA
jgi:catechol 2,3-dioxygenase-like lactoylglutathione lyase family enzyme